ncbi:MAG TPA: hypothetical protein VNF06_00805 [Candidatus Aquilonibacter sp.]|nr:hypothetical protein [Candidatus Aquilonibacter sp.]
MFEKFRPGSNRELNSASVALIRKEISAEEVRELSRGLNNARELLVSMNSFVAIFHMASSPLGLLRVPRANLSDEMERQTRRLKEACKEISQVLVIIKRADEQILPRGTVKGFESFAKMYEELIDSVGDKKRHDKIAGEFSNFMIGTPMFGRSGLARLTLQVMEGAEKVRSKYSKVLGGA